MSSKSIQGNSTTSTFVRPNTFTREGGLKIKRLFSKKGKHPFDEVEWELRSASITDEKGKVIFEQKDVEVPQELVPDCHQHCRVQIFSRGFRNGKAGTLR